MAEHKFTGPTLCRLEAHEVVRLVKRGEVSPQELIDAAFSRHDQVDAHINAMPITCRERAETWLSTHDFSAANRRSKEANWLAGLPITIKDLSDVAGVRTTCGTIGLKDFIPKQSDPLVERLEANGGIVIGKTNSPEMGAGGNTYNEVFGPTRNPWNTSLNAGGSSGGAAASLASGQAWLSHGSDHGGSLRTPAAYCGIVGLRPSPGRAGGASSYASFGLEAVQGPMARSVTDCALFLDAMAGFEPRHPISFPAPEQPFGEAVKRAGFDIRIAWSPDLGGLFAVEAQMAEHLDGTMKKLVREGITVDLFTPDLNGLERAYHVLRGLSFLTGQRFLPPEITRHFKETIRQNTEFGRNLSATDIADAHIIRSQLFDNVTALLKDFDVLACPVVGNMARPVEMEWVKEINGIALEGYMDWLRPAFLATTTGLPAISVPVGLGADKMPVGLQLIGPHRGEAKLLAVARAVEMAVGAMPVPIDPVVTHR